MEIKQENKKRLEYDLYECPFMYSLKDALFFIKDSQEFLDDTVSTFASERRKNCFRKAISKALGNRCHEFGYMSPVDYDIDNGLLELEEAISIGNICWFQELADGVNDDNVSKVTRLAHFLQDNCEDDLGRIENYRKFARENNGYMPGALFDRETNFEGLKSFFDKAKVEALHVDVARYTKISNN